MNNPLKYVDPDGEWFFSLLFPPAAPALIFVDLFLWGATIDYVSQVTNNYMTKEYYDHDNEQWVTRSNKDLWVNDVDFFDVVVTGLEYTASIIPGVGPYAPQLIGSPFKNLIDFKGGDWEVRSITDPYFYINTAIDYVCIGVSYGASKYGFNSSKPGPKNVTDWLKGQDVHDWIITLGRPKLDPMLIYFENSYQRQREAQQIIDDINRELEDLHRPRPRWDDPPPYQPPVPSPKPTGNVWGSYNKTIDLSLTNILSLNKAP